MKFSIISKHPLRNEYMLYCPVASVPPYFGYKIECEKARIKFENKLKEEFDKLPDDRKKEVVDNLSSYN